MLDNYDYELHRRKTTKSRYRFVSGFTPGPDDKQEWTWEELLVELEPESGYIIGETVMIMSKPHVRATLFKINPPEGEDKP